MRYFVAIVETVLAVAFFATVVSQLISEKFGIVNLASDLILIAIGLWLAKVAIANFKARPGIKQA